MVAYLTLLSHSDYSADNYDVLGFHRRICELFISTQYSAKECQGPEQDLEKSEVYVANI